MKTWSPSLRLLLKVLFAAGLIVLVFHAADAREVIRTLRGVSLPLFLLVVAGHFVLMGIKAWRWQGLCARAGVAVPYPRALRAYTTAFAFGTFTPGQVGDLGKIFLLRLPPEDRRSALFGAVVDRLWDVAGLAVSAGLAAAYLYGVNRQSYPLALAAAAVLLGGTVLVWFLHRPLRTWVQRRWRQDLRDLVAFSPQAFQLTLAAVLVQFARWMILGAALNLPWLVAGAAAILGTLVALLPVTVAGLGTREAVLAWVFHLQGLDTESGVALSLGMFAAYLIGALAGALLLLAGSGRKPREEGVAP